MMKTFKAAGDPYTYQVDGDTIKVQKAGDTTWTDVAPGSIAHRAIKDQVGSGTLKEERDSLLQSRGDLPETQDTALTDAKEAGGTKLHNKLKESDPAAEMRMDDEFDMDNSFLDYTEATSADDPPGESPVDDEEDEDPRDKKLSKVLSKSMDRFKPKF
jgi:hypothetical protein